VRQGVARLSIRSQLEGPERCKGEVGGKQEDVVAMPGAPVWNCWPPSCQTSKPSKNETEGAGEPVTLQTSAIQPENARYKYRS
jgi:hypothetical protein